MKELSVDLKNYQSENTVFHRTAARGIIRHGEEYLMIYSKHGDYKFPGGGKHDDETLADTLVREVKEETGYIVRKDSIYEYLKITEKRKGITADLMIMESYYYFCDVEEQIVERNLDDYEKEDNYQTVWLTLTDALAHNESINCIEKEWVVREITVIKELLKKE